MLDLVRLYGMLRACANSSSDYKRSKSHDVIGTLISLFDSQDVFVRELQNILGERLLLPNTNLEKEVSTSL
jgi:anaphase-promoting complex subunit 2